jgi:hypothetical protein
MSVMSPSCPASLGAISFLRTIVDKLPIAVCAFDRSGAVIHGVGFEEWPSAN